MATNTATVRRFNIDTYDENGKAEARTFSEFTARVALQPVSGRDIARLPEGVHASDLITLHSTTELKARDRVTVSGRGAFEVEKLLQWGDCGGFWKAFARQLDPSEPRS